MDSNMVEKSSWLENEEERIFTIFEDGSATYEITDKKGIMQIRYPQEDDIDLSLDDFIGKYVDPHYKKLPMHVLRERELNRDPDRVYKEFEEVIIASLNK